MNKRIIISIIIVFTLFFTGCTTTGNSFFNSLNSSGKKTEWLTNAFETIKIHPEIKLISYWSEEWEQFSLPVDLTLSSGDDAKEAYQTGVADNHFLTQCLQNNQMKLIPAVNVTSHCAYLGFFSGVVEDVSSEKINQFESLAGKELALVYFNDDWSDGVDFPLDAVQIISIQNAVLFIGIMSWSSYQIEGNDPVYNMHNIIDGV